MLTYSELLTKRRSIRDFEPKKVAKNVIQEIIQEACLAPSASNGQPWKFIVINNQTLMQKLSTESKKNILAKIEQDPTARIARYKATLTDADFNVFYNAPCLVIICGKKESDYFQRDCSLAVAYLMFAATVRGLGTCWIGLGDQIQDTKLRQEIGLPDDYEIAAPIIIGYPKQIPAPTPRNAPIILKTID